RGAIGLVPVRRQDRAVLTVGQRDLRARREADRGVLDVGRRQRGVCIIRTGREPARQREQVLALVVEDVLLLPVEILDRKSIQRQLTALGHPLLYGRQRNFQELGIEPRARLSRLREQNLDLLPPRVDRVVA